MRIGRTRRSRRSGSLSAQFPIPPPLPVGRPFEILLIPLIYSLCGLIGLKGLAVLVPSSYLHPLPKSWLIDINDNYRAIHPRTNDSRFRSAQVIHTTMARAAFFTHQPLIYFFLSVSGTLYAANYHIRHACDLRRTTSHDDFRLATTWTTTKRLLVVSGSFWYEIGASYSLL